jgi:hypothetical protein
LVEVGDVAEPLACAEPEAVVRGVALPDEAAAEPADGESDGPCPGCELDDDGLVVL